MRIAHSRKRAMNKKKSPQNDNCRLKTNDSVEKISSDLFYVRDFVDHLNRCKRIKRNAVVLALNDMLHLGERRKKASTLVRCGRLGWEQD